MKKIAIRAFAVQLIMAPSTCLNVIDGSRHGPDQFAAGRSLPRDDADRPRDGSGKADGCDAAGRKPAGTRLPGAAQNGAVREARQRPLADGIPNSALYARRGVPLG